MWFVLRSIVNHNVDRRVRFGVNLIVLVVGFVVGLIVGLTVVSLIMLGEVSL